MFQLYENINPLMNNIPKWLGTIFGVLSVTGLILSRTTRVILYPLLPGVPSLYPRFSDVFREYKKKTPGSNRLNIQ